MKKRTSSEDSAIRIVLKAKRRRGKTAVSEKLVLIKVQVRAVSASVAVSEVKTRNPITLKSSSWYNDSVFKPKVKNLLAYNLAAHMRAGAVQISRNEENTKREKISSRNLLLNGVCHERIFNKSLYLTGRGAESRIETVRARQLSSAVGIIREWP